MPPNPEGHLECSGREGAESKQITAERRAAARGSWGM